MTINRLPDFLVIGSMKSGTTTLYEYLTSHPRVFMCTPKEPRFFSLDERFARGIQWYSSLFDDANSDQLVGEASTCYSRWPFHPHVAERLHRHVPNAKFIYVMRDPVKRAYSHYRHRMEERVASGLDVLSFSRAIELDPEITETGLYARQIGKYLERFSTSQFHFVLFEEMTSDPRASLGALFQFLGLNYTDSGRRAMQFNESGSALAKQKIDNALRNLRQTALLRPLVDIIPPPARHRLFHHAKRLSEKSPLRAKLIRDFQAKIPPYSAQDREAMAAYYRTPNRTLQTLLGREISCWTK